MQGEYPPSAVEPEVPAIDEESGEKVYQRAYRACEGCRSRKAKCVSSNTNHLNTTVRAPCVRCVRSNRECIVSSESQRGKWKGRKRKAEEGHEVSSATLVAPRDSTHSARAPDHVSPVWNAQANAQDLSGVDRGPVQSFSVSPSAHPSTLSQVAAGMEASQITHKDLIRAELQNPADALDILCSVTGHASAAPSRMPSPPPSAADGAYGNSWPLDGSSYLTLLLEEEQPVLSLYESCQLVRDGILSEDRLQQLVDTFIKSYHPYYPLVATKRLAPMRLGRFAADDPILLAAICVIASRSDINDQLHVELLKIVKEMLSSAMWGGCATVGAIEALLLLSEWVAPQLQIHSGEKVKESSTIWMIVGTAVRLGYLQGLDKTSFVESGAARTLQATSRQRRTLAWASCYWSDRSISVRMGRGFWSRGPGPVAARNRGNFPTLFTESQLDGQDYALVMQAHLDLIQLMANVQDTLYPSKARQAQIIERGDYARYLDDYNRGVEGWRAEWAHLQWSRPTWKTLMISFYYLQLYVNSFALSATLVRAEAAQAGQTPPSTLSVFEQGIGKLPDARFIRQALDAASLLIEEFLRCDEQGQDSLLVYMPSRYYSYMIYAAVFALKAVRIRALTGSEALLASDLVRRAIRCLRIVAQVCPHPAAQYANLLDAYILRIQLQLQHEDRPVAQYQQQRPPVSADQDAYTTVPPVPVPFDFNLDFLNAPLFSDSGCPASGIDSVAIGGIDPSSFGDWASIIENGMEGLPSLSWDIAN